MEYKVFYESSFNRGSITELTFQAAGDLMALAIANPNIGGRVGSLDRESVRKWINSFQSNPEKVWRDDSPRITVADLVDDIRGWRTEERVLDWVALVENLNTGETLYLNREVFRKLGLPIPMPTTTPSMPFDDNDPIWLKIPKK
jgi:hypothetical protein